MLLSLQIILLNLLTNGLLCLSYVPEILCFVFIVSETKLSEKVTGKEKAFYKNRKGDPASISDGHYFLVHMQNRLWIYKTATQDICNVSIG